MKIRTLGLYQPYASLMLHGKIETRWVKKGKKPPFPIGTYLIYSCKKKYNDQQLQFVAGIENFYEIKRLLGGSWTPDGHAICVGELVRVVKWDISDPDGNSEAYTKSFVVPTHDAEYDRWLLYFENVKAVKPFPFKGKQGVGFYTGDLSLLQ